MPRLPLRQLEFDGLGCPLHTEQQAIGAGHELIELSMPVGVQDRRQACKGNGTVSGGWAALEVAGDGR